MKNNACVDTWYEMLEADLGAGYTAVYTDGSFDAATGRYSYGCVIFDIDGTETHLSGTGDDPDFAISHNIPGEISGALAALAYAKEKGRKRINIYHDYSGLMHWAKGEWKAKTKIAVYYLQELNKYKDIEIVFTKVKGHSKNPYNDLADALASEALKK